MANYAEKYVTAQGETWDVISEAFYDTAYYAADLIAQNMEYSDVLVFGDGIELTIPIIESAAPDTLPPWKR